MKLKKITLKNFKNLGSDFIANPTFNMIIGGNGIGKTNFLESIYYLSRARSLRHEDERHLINWESAYNFAKFEAECESDKGEIAKFSYIISNQENQLKKKFLIDERSIIRRNFSYKIPALIFLPQDIDFINGSPQIRRDNVDDVLEMISSEFKEKFLAYQSVLKNRNQLLKSVRAREASDNELEYWDGQLILLGSQIIHERFELMMKILPSMCELAEKIFAEDLRTFGFEYLSNIIESKSFTLPEINERFGAKIYAGRDKEINAAMTLYGPQRDDIKFVFGKNKKSFHEFGSRGQQRIVTIIFKLAVWFYYFAITNDKPILLLDDIMCELDENHRAKLEKALLDIQTQCFITSTTKNDFSSALLDRASFVRV